MKPNWEMETARRLSNSGVVVSLRGSVVDIHFDANFPPIHTLLHAM